VESPEELALLQLQQRSPHKAETKAACPSNLPVGYEVGRFGQDSVQTPITDYPFQGAAGVRR
jgi:hypothetical protein